MTREEINQILRQSKPLYRRPDIIRLHTQQLLLEYPELNASLAIRNNESKLEINGNIKIHHINESEYIKVRIIISDDYPSEKPLLFINNRENIKIKKSIIFTNMNEIDVPQTAKWSSYYRTLLYWMKQNIMLINNEYNKITFGINQIRETDIRHTIFNEINKLNNTIQYTVLDVNLSKIYLEKQKNNETQNILTSNFDISKKDVLTALKKNETLKLSGEICLRFQPTYIKFICINLNFARMLLICANRSKYLDSGISFENNRIMVTVRKNSSLKFPIANQKGKLIISKTYLNTILSETNRNISEDQNRLCTLLNAIKIILNDSRIQEIKLLDKNFETPTKIITETNTISKSNKIFMNLLDFPNEIFQKIMLLLNGNTLRNCKSLNREWYDKIDNTIWKSLNAITKLNKKLENNWKTNNHSTEVKKLSFDFRFPELVAENATSFILFSTSKGYENFAHYNIKTDKLWIIEEERSMFRTTNIRMNESIIILYKETRNNKGIMKVYSIENRRKIYNQDMIDLIDFVLDSRSNTKTVIVFYKDKIEILFFETTGSVKIHSKGIRIENKPLYPFYLEQNLSFVIYNESQDKHSLYIWSISPKSNTFVKFKYIHDLESFVSYNQNNSVLLHKVIFISPYIISHGCYNEEYASYCCIRILDEDGSIIRNLMFNDSLKMFPHSCLGMLHFTFETNKLFIHRKYIGNGIYIIDILTIFKPEININVSNLRIIELDQYKQATNFVQKMFCKYVINKTFAASIYIDDDFFQNDFQHSLISIKILKYFGHN